MTDGDAIVWKTETFEQNPNANALRWGTLYNFRFETNVAPEASSATIGLFRFGVPDAVSATTVGPAGGIVDCNANSIVDLCDISCDAQECEQPCGTSDDCDENMIPDECDPDCNENGIADLCDLRDETSRDCDGNQVPDECDPDCDDNGVPDACEPMPDMDLDGIDDCDDLCPETTPEGLCRCPEIDHCCFDTGLCVDGFLRDACLEFGGTPDCTSSPCRDGCLVGDSDRDGDLDLNDTAAMWGCFGGSGGASGLARSTDECLLRFDFDDQDDVDLDDYARFLSDYTGPDGGTRH